MNDRVNVPIEFYRTVRGILRLWDKRGLDVAARHFQPHISIDQLVATVRGMIGYIGQVTGPRDKRYRDLLGAFKKLRGGDLAGLHLN